MDREFFTKCILENEQSFYRISKTVLRSDSDCEDAVHNAILNAYKHLGSLREDSFFKTWFVRILLNECYKISRYNRRYISAEQYSPSAEAVQDESYTELYEAVSGLPEKIRLAVVLHYIEDMTVEDTAKTLRIPVGTVKSRLNTGRRLLRQFLEDDYEDK